MSTVAIATKLIQGTNMQAVREVTVWQGISRQPNHIYLMDGERALAYIKWGQGEPEWFKSGLRLDRRGRKFVPADIGLFGRKTESRMIRVEGSKGAVYWIDPDAGTCTCPGFQFRGACRHIKEHNHA